MISAYVTFDEDEEFGAEIDNVVDMQINGEQDMLLIHSHEKGGCNDYYIPRERVKMVVVRTEPNAA